MVEDPLDSEEWKHLKPRHDVKTLFQQEGQGSACKFGCINAKCQKVTPTSPPAPPSAILWIKHCPDLCDVERHYAPLNAQLFSLCLNRKGHTGSCQHAKGHVISNKGVYVISKAAERRVKLG